MKMIKKHKKEYKFSNEEIERMVKECFYENENYVEIKRVFKALAKM